MPDGLDIATWQRGIPINALKGEGIYFVIHKASGANGGSLYVDSQYNNHGPKIRAQGIRIGHYFFNGSVDAVASANYFVDHLNGYTDDDILALDVEGEDLQGVGWSIAWFDQVKKRIPNAKLYLYTTQSIVRQWDWSPVVARGVKLWIAAPDNNNPYVGEFGEWAIHQYTWNASIAGFGPLDGNHSKAYVWATTPVTPLKTADQIEEEELAQALEEIKKVLAANQSQLLNAIRRDQRERLYRIKGRDTIWAVNLDTGRAFRYGSPEELAFDVRMQIVSPIIDQNGAQPETQVEWKDEEEANRFFKRLAATTGAPLYTDTAAVKK